MNINTNRTLIALILVVFAVACGVVLRGRTFERETVTVGGISGEAVVTIMTPVGHSFVGSVIFIPPIGMNRIVLGRTLKLFVDLGLTAVVCEQWTVSHLGLPEVMPQLTRFLLSREGQNSQKLCWISEGKSIMRLLPALSGASELQPSLILSLPSGVVLTENQPLMAVLPADKSPTTIQRLPWPLRTSIVMMDWDGVGGEPNTGAYKRCEEVASSTGRHPSLWLLPKSWSFSGFERWVTVGRAAEYAKTFMNGTSVSFFPKKSVRYSFFEIFMAALAAFVLSLIAVKTIFGRHLRLNFNKHRICVYCGWMAGAGIGLLMGGFIVSLPLFTSGKVLAHEEEVAWLVKRGKYPEPVTDKILKNAFSFCGMAHHVKGKFYRDSGHDFYRSYILAPVVDESIVDLVALRRQLWGYCSPSFDSNIDPFAAAYVVAHVLRNRVVVDRNLSDQYSLIAVWNRRVGGILSFQRLYVSALRAVGIAARMGADGSAELFSAGKWVTAPPAIFSSLSTMPEPSLYIPGKEPLID